MSGAPVASTPEPGSALPRVAARPVSETEIRAAAVGPLLFRDVCAPDPRWVRKPIYLVLSAALHVGAAAALAVLGAHVVQGEEVAVPVRFVRSSPVTSPTLPARGTPRPAHRARRQPPPPLVQPKALPDSLPVPGPPEEPFTGELAPTPVLSPGPPGTTDGVVGGDPGALAQEPPALPPARPADLAAVRAGIARTLTYPAEARRQGWEGRATIAFVLRADGTIEEPEVRQGSGHDLLDRAALAAIRTAAPFPPPGIDVLVVVPVSFRLR